MSQESKKYKIIENVLQKINSMSIALPDDETKRNNQLLQIVKRAVQKLRSKSVLFDNLYQDISYVSSFYDGLKIGSPNEYDLDCNLRFPKVVGAMIEESDKPGYVHVVLRNLEALQKNETEGAKYPNLDKLLDGNFLSTKKIRSWIESLIDTVFHGNLKMDVNIDGTACSVKIEIIKSGPALTIKLEGVHNLKNFELKIDFVPCFIFPHDQWPKNGYRQNISQNKKTFFVVPKSPNDFDVHNWRLSFQEQERELLHNYKNMKSCIRLIKKIRDRHDHNIASYFIKTVFMWELEKFDKNFWEQSLSFVFMIMLRKYGEYIKRRNIPNYWHEGHNLIEDLSEETAFCITNKIRNIADHIDRICSTNAGFYDIVKYFLKPNEYDLENFKQEVSVSKKLLKRLESEKNLSYEDSVTLSSEEIPPSDVARLESLCLHLASEQEKIVCLLERLGEDLERKKKEDERQRNELMDRIELLDEKIDRLMGKKEL
ncbi:uncharacterized protein LOC123016253 [Tribolium madens]|uniref:uncharacterized protein LOC123016253 n=1 Tax=Tribolium madens TaxID=41895 RepID=UPI001CF7205C|nr:uncharacterized protein LOC123016253 [Tribolium madens]XP_044272472.1 uncharacterized protein LOC123016253 [Tribolium madens]XP_044272483.1 uncharacterized protein LOC123016253 [Tribolium madens]XP_044272492.1 uncharacterized protein LOC123016253 [Tribolium madens]XP_044272500.1 uncharacterized protein LOC123016253 [Tribolium madens]